MSSKLDQMRDEFRERLNLRPVSQTRVHLINVENNDNNNNNKDSQFGKTHSLFAKNTIPSHRNQKNAINPSKVNANKLSHFSNYSKNYGSNETESKDFREKVESSKESPKRADLCSVSYKTKDKKLEDSRNKFSEGSALKRVNTEGMACRYCRRRFALSERLEKHQSVCMSSLDKSRIKFDSFEQRVKGQPNDYLLIYENASKVSSNNYQNLLIFLSIKLYERIFSSYFT